MTSNSDLRYEWTVSEIESIYSLPLPELIFQAQLSHRKFHQAGSDSGLRPLECQDRAAVRKTVPTVLNLRDTTPESKPLRC